jgi:hypothetical protein
MPAPSAFRAVTASVRYRPEAQEIPFAVDQAPAVLLTLMGVCNPCLDAGFKGFDAVRFDVETDVISNENFGRV